MACSRLLLPKPGTHSHRKGFPKPTRWFSSSASSNWEPDKSSHLKRSEAAKEKRAVSLESYVKKYMETRPGSFPKVTQIQNKVGAPWYTLKGILTNLKETMLGNSQNHVDKETSDSMVDTTTCDVTTTHHSSDNTQLQRSEGTVQSSEAMIKFHSSKKEILMSGRSHTMEENLSNDRFNTTSSDDSKTHNNPYDTNLSKPDNLVISLETIMDSCNNEKNVSTSAAPHAMEENNLENVANATVSDFIKMENDPDSSELVEPESIIQSSEAIRDSYSNEEIMSTSITSHMMGGNSSEDMFQSQGILDSSKPVEPDGRRQLGEAVSSILAGFDRDQKLDSEQLFCSTHQLLSEEASRELEIDGANKSTSVGNRSHQSDKKIASGQILCAGSKLDGMPTSSGGTQKVIGLADLFKRTTNNGAAGEMRGKEGDVVTSNRFIEFSNEIGGKDVVKCHDIKGLIDFIKELPPGQSVNEPSDNIISNRSDEVCSQGLCKKMQSWANVQKADNKDRQTLLKDHTMGNESSTLNKSKEKLKTKVPSKKVKKCKIVDGNRSISIVAASDDRKSEQPVSLQMSKEELIKCPNRADQNSALKMGGVQNAVNKTDMLVKNADAIVEATFSMKDVSKKISIPNLIGYPDVPVALVKNPTRTVMIRQLTHGISSHHLEEVLAFCGSDISGFFFGSSSSVAYVEFETEDAKERAIAKHTIFALGKQLLIFRIDAPRTTVVRISNVNVRKLNTTHAICSCYGQVKNVVYRSKNITDVHFVLAEWPRMLNILNSLNGRNVDGNRWVAQPAPVFPPEILPVLWNQPDERRHLKVIMRSLFHELRKDPLDTAGLTDLAAKYYRDGF